MTACDNHMGDEGAACLRPRFHAGPCDAVFGDAVVVNLYRDKFDVYIGRTGRGCEGYFGNPFADLRCRVEMIEKFREYFSRRLCEDPEFKGRVLELRGKRLGCFCKPRACHGDVIADWLNHGARGA